MLFPGRGSRTLRPHSQPATSRRVRVGLALLFVIWLITIASSFFFVSQTWWMPAGAAVHAAAIDRQFHYTYILMGVVFVAAQAALGLFAWKYRDRGPKGQVYYSHGNTRMEMMWTVLTAILFIGLNVAGTKIWASERFQPAKAGAFAVEATGVQFAWYFRYPGADGTYGRVKPELQDASAGGEAAVGLDTTDAAAKDDLVSSTLVLPVNREVDLTLRAQDVIHSLYIPAMRFKQDAVPGLMIHMHFTPNQVGDYEIACAELCGLGHYKMRANLRVMSQTDFDKWLAERKAEKE
jgi:cytochrome c oxidase subunit II